MIALRISAALSLSSAALLGGAWTGGAFEIAAPAARDGATRTGGPAPAIPLAQPPGSSGAIAVGDSLEVSGLPMKLSLFFAGDAPSRVIGFYADAFGARGLLPVVSKEEAFAHLSVFDPSDRVQRFVGAIEQPGGGTLVVTGTADARRVPGMLAGAGATTLPVPREHGALLAFRSADGAARAESAHFITRLPPAAVESFYREALGREGYAEAGSRGAGPLTFERPGVTFSVTARERGGDGTAAFVTRVERGR